MLSYERSSGCPVIAAVQASVNHTTKIAFESVHYKAGFALPLSVKARKPFLVYHFALQMAW